jgi:flagellar biogenesis protein FliO
MTPMTPTSSLTMLYAFHFHIFVSLVAIFGMIMLMCWAIKYLPPEKLKRVALWTFVIGTIGVILTVPFCIVGRNLLGM